MFFDGLFKDNDRLILRAIELKKDAKKNGEKISIKDAIKLAKKTAPPRKIVTEKELYNKFYKVINEIKDDLNSNINKIFESSEKKITKLLSLMILIIFLLITIFPIFKFYFEYYNINEFILIATAISIFTGVIFALIILVSVSIMLDVYEKKSITIYNIVSIFSIILIGKIFLKIPFSLLLLPALLEKEIYLITYIIGIVSIFTISLFKQIIPKRTKYGTKMIGKLNGFKRFLETAEKDQLENLVFKNPEYFYNILPYTYALDVSDIWISQFESIALSSPKWYDSHTSFNNHKFGDFMNNTMRSISKTMSSSPSSTHSSGSSSGGGSSGGGSGGGGGGSW